MMQEEEKWTGWKQRDEWTAGLSPEWSEYSCVNKQARRSEVGQHISVTVTEPLGRLSHFPPNIYSLLSFFSYLVALQKPLVFIYDMDFGV